jgi:hypothetical protein
MTFKEKVKDLLNKALEENLQLFLIDLDFSETNKISVVIDGDSGVNLQDCININKFILFVGFIFRTFKTFKILHQCKGSVVFKHFFN